VSAAGDVTPIADTGAAMSRRSYTDEQKAEALALYAEHGPAVASERTGIAKGTVASWAHRGGVHTSAIETTRVATAVRLATLEQRKAQLAADLMGDIERLRGQLFAPCTERKVVTLAGGQASPSTWDIVDVDHDEPTFGDKKALMTTIAIAVDKVQILTGAATERIDHRHTSPIDEELESLATQLEHEPERVDA
jgi:transposase-like protein